jgi:putative ABC transport system permease protein
MRFLRQLGGLVRVGIAGLGGRLGSVLTIIVGVTCAVGVLVSMLAMGTGARRQEQGDARADRVILMSTGSRPRQSNISKQEAAVVSGMSGIRKDAAGKPIVLLESLVPIEGRRRVTGNRIYFPLIGVSPNLTAYRPEIRFTAGRMFNPGHHELIVSNPCVRQFQGFERGARRTLHGSDWAIVGLFDQGREQQQCIVYADVDSIMSTFSRNTYSAVSVMLDSASGFGSFRDRLSADPSVKLSAEDEPTATEESFAPLNGLLNFISLFIGTIMALGATLGAVNALYAIVDSRRRDLATLRALGFSAGAVVLATLLESMLLAIPGALLGSLLAWMLFDGLAASPFGYSFQLAVTPALALLGIEWALVMGLLGGLLPALRAARVPVTTALRAV